MSNSSRRSDQHYHHCNYPSFSSSLLEEIYRSFDEDSERDLSSHRSDPTNNTSSSYKKLRSSNNKSSNFSYGFTESNKKRDDNFRVNRFVLDQWMKENTSNDHNNSQKINSRRNSMPNTTVQSVAKFNSSSSTSSSDSSSGICGSSSSDTDSLYGSSKSKSKLKPTLKPIKTTASEPEFHRKSEIPTDYHNRKSNHNSNHNERNKEGNLQKRALKLYGDLKKVKQPISPGGKLATFLNSLFNSNASKKAKISSSSTTTSSSSLSSNAVKYSMTMSTPSTASSYSRSCLSKTPSSAGRFERRSVRFCPVNTVMAYDDEREDEDEEDNLRTKASKNNDELKVQIMEEHRRVEEVAKELLKNYQYHERKFQSEVNHSKKNNNIISSFEDEDEDEDEDDASCCSSDLFELDNLLEIGGGNHQRYCEELPVYETTHVHTNRAIAKGYIL